VFLSLVGVGDPIALFFKKQQDVLKRNEEHQEALIEYGIALRDRGLKEDALRVFLKLLVHRSEDKIVRENVADLVEGEAGVARLLQEFKETASSAAAFAFLAVVVKDWGSKEVSRARGV
jgi:hypothetical protein